MHAGFVCFHLCQSKRSTMPQNTWFSNWCLILKLREQTDEIPLNVPNSNNSDKMFKRRQTRLSCVWLQPATHSPHTTADSRMCIFQALKLTLFISCCSSAPSFTISYANNTFLRNGVPHRYVSGSMHYFRIPPEMWRDRMMKMRLAGLNTLQMALWLWKQPLWVSAERALKM